MKLLMLCNRIPFPPKDGGSLAMYNLICGYAAEGVDLTIFAINTRKHYMGAEDMGPLQSMANVHAIALDTDVKPWDAFLNLFSSKSYNIERFNAPVAHEKLETLLKQEVFDLVQIESIFMAPYIPTLRQNSDAPVVLRAHNVEHQIWHRMVERESRILKKWYLKLLAKRLSNYEHSLSDAFDGILPITEEDGEWFKNAGFNVPQQVTPVGIDTAEFQSPAADPQPGTVFHIGSLDWMPNEEALEWFIEEIWPLIQNYYPEATFHIAGRHMPEWIYQLYEPGIKVEGEVPNAKDFMENKQVMVVPLLSGSGIRVKILEGMALGKCIVTTSLGAQGIHCTPGEHLIIADQPKAFAKKVVECLNDPEMARRTGENARQFVREHFDNKAITAQTLDFFKTKVLDSPT